MTRDMTNRAGARRLRAMNHMDWSYLTEHARARRIPATCIIGALTLMDYVSRMDDRVRQAMQY